MTDITLSNGTEITFDLNKITRREYLSLLDPQQDEEESYKAIEKTCDLSAQEIGDLGQEDFRRFMLAFWKKAREPLADPNA
jgi:hypothetical protein